MQTTNEQYQLSSRDARDAWQYQTDRELLSALAGEDIAGKLSDAECARLIQAVTRLISGARQKDFDDGWGAAIDYAADFAEAFFAPKTKAH